MLINTLQEKPICSSFFTLNFHYIRNDKENHLLILTKKTIYWFLTSTYLQVQCDIGPTMETTRGYDIQSTIEYPSFLEARNWLQNNSFQKFCSTINHNWNKCDGVMLEICLDHKFHWSQGGLNCESLA